MPVEPVPGCEDAYVVDALFMDLPGTMSAFLVDAERPALVDAGPATAVDVVLDGLAAVGVDPADLAAIVPTHVHLDHAGATAGLAAACPDATVYVHERGLAYLTDRDRLDDLVESARRAMGEDVALYGEPGVVPAERCEPLAGGESLDLGDRSLRVVDAPGHAPHQCCLFDPADGTLFAADAAGMDVAGRLYPTTPPPSFDLEAALDTVDRLRTLDPDRICYGHFGVREDATAALREYADLLPEWVDRVAELRAEYDSAGEIVGALEGRWQSPTVSRDVPGVLQYLDGQDG